GRCDRRRRRARSRRRRARCRPRRRAPALPGLVGGGARSRPGGPWPSPRSAALRRSRACLLTRGGREGAKGGWPDGRHAEDGGAVAAHDGDRLVDLRAFGGGELVQAGFHPADEVADPADLLLGRGGVGAGPVVGAVEGGDEAFTGAWQVIEVGGQVGQVGGVGAEVVAAGAAEPRWAGPAGGLHVGWFGAAAVGDGDLADGVAVVGGLQQRRRVAPEPVAVPVEAEGGDPIYGGPAPV